MTTDTSPTIKARASATLTFDYEVEVPADVYHRAQADYEDAVNELGEILWHAVRDDDSEVPLVTQIAEELTIQPTPADDPFWRQQVVVDAGDYVDVALDDHHITHVRVTRDLYDRFQNDEPGAADELLAVFQSRDPQWSETTIDLSDNIG